MTEVEAVRAWYQDYLGAWMAWMESGSIEDRTTFLASYAVPLLLSADGGMRAIASAEDLADQFGHLREALIGDGYARTEQRAELVTLLNASTALYTGSFVRRRHDGSAISAFGATYVIAADHQGHKIYLVAQHAEEPPSSTG